MYFLTTSFLENLYRLRSLRSYHSVIDLDLFRNLQSPTNPIESKGVASPSTSCWCLHRKISIYTFECIQRNNKTASKLYCVCNGKQKRIHTFVYTNVENSTKKNPTHIILCTFRASFFPSLYKIISLYISLYFHASINSFHKFFYFYWQFCNFLF